MNKKGVIYEPGPQAREYALLALNHYRGCKFSCDYCYVPTATFRGRAEFHATVEPRKNVLARIEKEAPRHRGTDKRVLLCFSCDPYPEIEASRGLTRDVLNILKRHDIPVQVLTKGGLLAARDFGLYRKDIDAFAVTLTAATDHAWRQMAREPGAAPPSDRIETLREAHERGIETWVSLEPVLDPEQSLAVMRATHKFVDLFKIGTLNHVKSDVTPEQWRSFGRRAIEYCVATVTKYFVKDDLAAYLGEFQFGNTDNRTVRRAAK